MNVLWFVITQRWFAAIAFTIAESVGCITKEGEK